MTYKEVEEHGNKRVGLGLLRTRQISTIEKNREVVEENLRQYQNKGIAATNWHTKLN